LLRVRRAAAVTASIIQACLRLVAQGPVESTQGVAGLRLRWGFKQFSFVEAGQELADLIEVAPMVVELATASGLELSVELGFAVAVIFRVVLLLASFGKLVAGEAKHYFIKLQRFQQDFTK